MCGHLMESNLVFKLDWVKQIVCFETKSENQTGINTAHAASGGSQIISSIIVLPARDINFGNIYIQLDYLILFLLSEQNTEQ